MPPSFGPQLIMEHTKKTGLDEETGRKAVPSPQGLYHQKLIHHLAVDGIDA
ncbi:hypothetical protein VP1G_11315 [Cytospora mali]|uniref:Uncharacterized protein n=1 Tax=Cytospora mali TaxID=578113 RepID=A0A194VCB2_CYTMA|nr:hypothetical protein VP1G_11315 [Valsa mali var. pyri (nom. inval.)]